MRAACRNCRHWYSTAVDAACRQCRRWCCRDPLPPEPLSGSSMQKTHGASASPFGETFLSCEDPIGSETNVDVDNIIDRFFSFQDGSSQAVLSFGTGSFGADVLHRTISTSKSISIRLPQKLPVQNDNRISQYQWLQDLLQTICDGSAEGSARIEDSMEKATPLFVVAGGCPNSWCSSMQAVMYSKLDESVGFWWIKPQEHNPAVLEQNTLNLHTKGQFKNAPGGSKALYALLADRFDGQAAGSHTMGVDAQSGRAFIDEWQSFHGNHARMWLYFVWQESWSKPWSGRKFLKGKLFYQKEGEGKDKFFARQFNLVDGQLFIMEAHTEERVQTLLPPNSLQQLYEMSD